MLAVTCSLSCFVLSQTLCIFLLLVSCPGYESCKKQEAVLSVMLLNGIPEVVAIQGFIFRGFNYSHLILLKPYVLLKQFLKFLLTRQNKLILP